MFTFNLDLRVRYAETDRMGYVYYGNYAAYFETARVESLRSLGISYKQMEDEGVMLPVLEYHIKYFKPALYDDVLTVKLSITDLPDVRIRFTYETYNAEGVQLNRAETTLVFVDIKSGKPCKPPASVLEVFKPYF